MLLRIDTLVIVLDCCVSTILLAVYAYIQSIKRYDGKKFDGMVQSICIRKKVDLRTLYANNDMAVSSLASTQKKLSRPCRSLTILFVMMWIVARGLNHGFPYTWLLATLPVPWILYCLCVLAKHYYETVNSRMKKEYPEI